MLARWAGSGARLGKRLPRLEGVAVETGGRGCACACAGEGRLKTRRASAQRSSRAVVAGMDPEPVLRKVVTLQVRGGGGGRTCSWAWTFQREEAVTFIPSSCGTRAELKALTRCPFPTTVPSSSAGIITSRMKWGGVHGVHGGMAVD